MASETDLLNDALSQIGAAPISAIDDGSVNADHCKRMYPALRRSLLRSHHWKFAETRTELARDAGSPAFEFAFSYTLPEDLLKLVEYNGVNMVEITTAIISDFAINIWITGFFKIEGRKLLTNDGQVKVMYVRDVPDPSQWH